MKSKALIKLMIVCLAAFGLIIFNINLVRGMNKADLVDKMVSEVGILRVSSNSLETKSSWQLIPPYNVLWPLCRSAMSPKDLKTSLEIPLVISFFSLNPWPPPYLLDWITEESIPNLNLLVFKLKAKTNVKVGSLADIWGLPPL